MIIKFIQTPHFLVFQDVPLIKFGLIILVAVYKATIWLMEFAFYAIPTKSSTLLYKFVLEIVDQMLFILLLLDIVYAIKVITIS
jgi:hypothetical protein